MMCTARQACCRHFSVLSCWNSLVQVFSPGWADATASTDQMQINCHAAAGGDKQAPTCCDLRQLVVDRHDHPQCASWGYRCWLQIHSLDIERRCVHQEQQQSMLRGVRVAVLAMLPLQGMPD